MGNLLFPPIAIHSSADMTAWFETGAVGAAEMIALEEALKMEGMEPDAFLDPPQQGRVLPALFWAGHIPLFAPAKFLNAEVRATFFPPSFPPSTQTSAEVYVGQSMAAPPGERTQRLPKGYAMTPARAKVRSVKAKTAREELLKRTRELITDKFSGRLPYEPKIHGIPARLGRESTLARWLAGETTLFNKRLTPKYFYQQVENLLLGLGAEPGEIDRLVTKAIFEDQKWSERANTARERLLLEARRGVAIAFGGTLSFDPKIEGIPPQNPRSVLTRWLRGRKIEFRQGLSTPRFYRQVQRLLGHVGFERRKIESLVFDAVFEQEGWEKKDQTAQERLLLEARKAVALAYGGRLPHHLKIKDLPRQEGGNTLTRWIRGKEIVWGGQLAPRHFYHQVKSLLMALGMGKGEVERLVQEAIFEINGWKAEADTDRERLLLAARERVALKLGGRLPNLSGIEGVPNQNERSTLTRWLKGDAIVFGSRLPSQGFYNQVKNLLVGLGMENEKMVALIRDAVFEEQGWEKEKTSAQDRLLLEARRLVEIHFGGRLPVYTGIEGIPIQYPKSPLSLWLKKGEVIFKRQFSPNKFYGQVRNLLVGLGLPPARVRSLIVEAVFEREGWPREAKAGEQRLLLVAREVVAFRFGGILSQRHPIPGVPVQDSHSPLKRWLEGESARLADRLSRQIHALILFDDSIDPKTIRREMIRMIHRAKINPVPLDIPLPRG